MKADTEGKVYLLFIWLGCGTVALKALGVLHLPWWAVLAPWAVPVLLVAACVVILLALQALVIFID